MKKSKLTSEKLSTKNLDELNDFIRKASKILNDRERYFEILSGRRFETGKYRTTDRRIKNLEIDDALYAMSSKAQELNAGRKTISKGKSVRFSGAKSNTIKQAYNRAIQMQNLLKSRKTTVEGLQQQYIAKLKGLSKEFWGDEDYTRISEKDWEEVTKFYEIGEKHGVPSGITYDYVVKPYSSGNHTFEFADQYDKWLTKQEKYGSRISLESDLQDYIAKLNEFRKMTRAEKQMYGLNDIDDLIDRFWQSFEEM